MISFGGLASGLDTNAIIKAMVDVERVPIQLLQARQGTEQAKLDLVGTFKDLVKGLQEKADLLRDADGFYAFTVSSSDESVASFTAAAGAEAGSHTLEVVSLAQADRWAFDGVLDPATDLATADGQSLDFTVNGTAYSIAVTAASSSLSEIASQINDLAGDDVSASVVNVGTEGSPSYQLVLSSDETGEDGRVTGISSSITGLTIDATGPDPSGNAQSASNITVGQNAVAIIDGLTVERSTNEFNGVVPGVDITLQSEGSGQSVFTVGADQETVKAQIQEFVDAYNGVVNFINGQNTYSEDDGAGGQLFGDNLLRTVRERINSALFNVPTADVMADTEGYSTLSLVGIKQSNDGTLSIDSTIFDAKFSENLDKLADLFVDTDGFDNGGAAEGTAGYYVDTTTDMGLADKLYRTLDVMFGSLPDGSGGSTDGLFDARTKALQKAIDSMQDSIDRKERYLETFEQSLIARFAELESLMAGLNGQGAALQNGLAGLAKNNQ
jgi:flagellar hook-associated protein 2